MNGDGSLAAERIRALPAYDLVGLRQPGSTRHGTSTRVTPRCSATICRKCGADGVPAGSADLLRRFDSRTRGPRKSPKRERSQLVATTCSPSAGEASAARSLVFRRRVILTIRYIFSLTGYMSVPPVLVWNSVLVGIPKNRRPSSPSSPRYPQRRCVFPPQDSPPPA